MAAAAVLDPGRFPDQLARRLDDSKKLRRKIREELFDPIHAAAEIGVGSASPSEIDDLNILQATLLAMRRAVDSLPAPPDAALIDGNQAPGLACPSQTVVKGDGRCLSIAAASIVAKVSRDRMMRSLANEHPVTAGKGMPATARPSIAPHWSGSG